MNMETKEELEFHLIRIKSYIKNCEWDLKGMFKDNWMIQDKLNKLREQKVSIERELEILK